MIIWSGLRSITNQVNGTPWSQRMTQPAKRANGGLVPTSTVVSRRGQGAAQQSLNEVQAVG
jgi:hypothetical protein